MIFEMDSVKETQSLAAELAEYLPSGAVLALAGDLGTGKTVFTQGLARGLGISGLVTSPTFTLINEYRMPNGRLLQHVDCYRLENAPLEMWDVGLADLFETDDIVVIEWADRIPGLLPAEHLEFAFTYLGENERRICVRGYGAVYASLLCRWAGLTKASPVITNNSPANITPKSGHRHL